MIVKAVLDIKDDVVDLLVDPGSCAEDELVDMLRFKLARLVRIEWEPVPGVRIIGADGHELEERAVGAWSAEVLE